MLRRIFGPKRDDVTGKWRRLHNKELYTPSSSSNIIRVIKLIRLRWAEHVACVGERRSPYRFLVEKPEERRPLGRRKPRWENSKWIFKKWGGVMHWIDLAEERDRYQAVVNAVMNLRVS